MATQEDLQKAGLKATSARLAILTLFETSTVRHQSAEQIHLAIQALGHDIALATVYRVLAQFEAADIVHKHRFDDEHSVYELNDGEHHDHLVCTECQKVEEFQNPIIESQQDLIAEQHHFTITGHNHHIYGICHECKSEK